MFVWDDGGSAVEAASAGVKDKVGSVEPAVLILLSLVVSTFVVAAGAFEGDAHDAEVGNGLSMVDVVMIIIIIIIERKKLVAVGFSAFSIMDATTTVLLETSTKREERINNMTNQSSSSSVPFLITPLTKKRLAKRSSFDFAQMERNNKIASSSSIYSTVKLLLPLHDKFTACLEELCAPTAA
jgi:hypothetical protein